MRKAITSSAPPRTLTVDLLRRTWAVTRPDLPVVLDPLLDVGGEPDPAGAEDGDRLSGRSASWDARWRLQLMRVCAAGVDAGSATNGKAPSPEAAP